MCFYSTTCALVAQLTKVKSASLGATAGCRRLKVSHQNSRNYYFLMVISFALHKEGKVTMNHGARATNKRSILFAPRNDSRWARSVRYITKRVANASSSNSILTSNVFNFGSLAD